MAQNIYHWAAIGYDPLDRFPNSIQIFFDYDASLITIHLTLQHLLGYMPYIADRFPYSAPLPNAKLDQETMLWTLDKPLSVQTELMKTKIFPSGVEIRHHLRSQVLFSPIGK